MVMLPAICKLTSGNLRFTSFPLSQLAVPGSPNVALVIALLLQLAIVLPILLPAAWLLLRRQKAPGPRPYPEP